MNLFAPSYYKNFKCIADKCSHSCCVGWEIDIDRQTYNKYQKLKTDYGKEILKSIEKSDTPHFILCENERCPHLDKDGLCEIITNLGEGYLCEICQEHPRFYNDTPYGKEVGLGMACEEACRIILNSDEYDKFYVIEELDGLVDDCGFDPTMYRTKIFNILRFDLPHEKKVDLICQEFNISKKLLMCDNWKKILSGLEYLDQSHKELFLSCNFNDRIKCNEKMLDRALAYFVYRHCTQAFDENEFYKSLGFALFCTALLRGLANNTEIEDVARIISEELEYSEENTETIKENIL